MMKICMLSSGHNPFDARIFHKEALSLRKDYQEVTILAPHQRGDEVKSGIRIVGLKVRRRWWSRFGPLAQMYRRGLSIGADVYHCHEADSLLVGYLIKRRLKCKLVYDSHELHSAQFPQHFPSFLRKLVEIFVRQYEKWLLGSVDYVITVNQIIRSYFLLLNPSVSVEVLYNCPPLRLFEESKGKGERWVLCHEGMINFDRGLEEIIQLLVSLKSRYPSIKLLIIGEVYSPIKEWLTSQIARFQLENHIEITGWLPYEQVGAAIQRAQLGLICYRALPNNMLAGPPNKLFNYMRYGLPVVSSDFPEIRRIIDENDCGVLVNPTDSQGFVAAVDSLLQYPEEAVRMGERGQKAVVSVYNWEKMEQRLLRVYKKLQRQEPGG
jgi:glycosyltransferase involved in cell wall biosynthesis